MRTGLQKDILRACSMLTWLSFGERVLCALFVSFRQLFGGVWSLEFGSFVVKIYTLCSPKGGHERLPKRMELQATYTWIQESELFYGFHYNLLRPRHGQAERHIEWSLERRGNEMNWTHIPRWRRGDWKNPRKGVLENQQN